jgi:hypothetical protein
LIGMFHEINHPSELEIPPWLWNPLHLRPEARCTLPPGNLVAIGDAGEIPVAGEVRSNFSFRKEPSLFWSLDYNTMWGPRLIAKLVYNSNNYGLWYL